MYFSRRENEYLVKYSFWQTLFQISIEKVNEYLVKYSFWQTQFFYSVVCFFGEEILAYLANTEFGKVNFAYFSSCICVFLCAMFTYS